MKLISIIESSSSNLFITLKLCPSSVDLVMTRPIPVSYNVVGLIDLMELYLPLLR
ncbi:MAG: hypothetical protein KAF41_03245 [Flavobacterium sp.]|nr:hypothetical protein [Flavobacterium sp.]